MRGRTEIDKCAESPMDKPSREGKRRRDNEVRGSEKDTRRKSSVESHALGAAKLGRYGSQRRAAMVDDRKSKSSFPDKSKLAFKVRPNSLDPHIRQYPAPRSSRPRLL